MFTTARAAKREKTPKSISEAFAGYDQHQLDALPALRAKLTRHLGPILDDFYGALSRDGAIGGILEGSHAGKADGKPANREERVAHLKAAQTAHWNALFGGQIGDDQKARGKRIGAAHVRVGLGPSAYVASYAYLTEAFVETLLADRSTRPAEISALMRAVFIDMAEALSAFLDINDNASRQEEAEALARTIEQEMRHINHAVGEQAQELAAVVDAMSRAVSDLGSGVSLVEAGTGSVADGIGLISSGAGEVLASSREVGRSAATTTDRVRQALGRTEAARESIASLEAETARIRKAVDLIDAIARQTNLLALNATIEAARAGEAGKGFAVVAAEVKSLSRSTAEATAEVARVVAGIDAASQRVAETMSEVGEDVRRIEALAADVLQATSDQERSLDAVAASATAADGGAADLRRSVELIDGGTSRAAKTTEEVRIHTTRMVELVGRLEQRLTVTLKGFTSLDRRQSQRFPERIAAELRAGDRQARLRTIDISTGGCLLPKPDFRLAAGEAVEVHFQGLPPLKARVSGDHPLGVRLQFVGVEKDERLAGLIEQISGRQVRTQDLVKAKAAEVAAALEAAVARGEVPVEALFDERYERLPGTNPPQFRTRALPFLARVLPGILDPVLDGEPEAVFAIATDRNGWAPAHNPAWSKPQGEDPVWNAANSRNLRIFDDRTGLSAARNPRDVLVQTYERQLGGGRTALMRDYSAPVRVDDRHWGCVRVGMRFD